MSYQNGDKGKIENKLIENKVLTDQEQLDVILPH